MYVTSAILLTLGNKVVLSRGLGVEIDVCD